MLNTWSSEGSKHGVDLPDLFLDGWFKIIPGSANLCAEGMGSGFPCGLSTKV